MFFLRIFGKIFIFAVRYIFRYIYNINYLILKYCNIPSSSTDGLKVSERRRFGDFLVFVPA